MMLSEWSKSKSNTGYSRKLWNSGLDGARSGREAFLREKPLALFLSESMRAAIAPTAIGMCLGIIGSNAEKGRISARRAIGYGLLGGTLGLAVGIAWHGRHLVTTITSGAMRNIEKVRDEHWLEQNPIDYA